MSNNKLENVVAVSKLESAQGRGPGARLRKAREAKGINIEEVARQLFLSSQMVQQLENDEYKSHHSITFIRGYLRSYARLVGLDTDALIAEFNALGLTDSVPLMSTQRIYHRENSIVSKGLPWVGSAIGILIVLFIVMWVHSEFSKEQIINPTASAVNAVAATVMQTNNSVNAALTTENNSLTASNSANTASENPPSDIAAVNSAAGSATDSESTAASNAPVIFGSAPQSQTTTAAPVSNSAVQAAATDNANSNPPIIHKHKSAEAKIKMATPF